MSRNSRSGEAAPPEASLASRERATEIRHSEEDAARERTRAVRFETEDRHRTRWRRWIKTTAIVASTVAGLGVTIDQFNKQSAQTRILFETEFEQSRKMFVAEAEDRQNARMVRAWQLLKSSVGETGNVGQITAPETLYIDGADLRNLSLGCVNLMGKKVPPCMYLARVYLGPIISDEIVRKADLFLANFSGADLNWADLRGANMDEADLRGADLFEADLRGAVIYDANLSGASLIGANLSGANLSGANLSRVIFSEANLSGADFENATGAPDLSESCADPDDPPINLPLAVKKKLPENWEWKPCPPSEEGN